MTNKFNPNEATFAQGENRVQQAREKSNLKIGEKIITSRDKYSIAAVNLLSVSNVPGGFKKWQLPFVMDRSQLFISIGSPDVMVPEHSHDEGDGIRFIMTGSIYYNGHELSSGDWMYIPKGVRYSIKVGPFGASMCYCYCCCCAGALLGKEAVINPNPLKN